MKNGFVVADASEITNKTYKGFSIVDPSQTVTEGTNDRDLIVVTNAAPRYTKTAIDNFRGGKMREFQDVNITDPKKLYGFQPGDILNAAGQVRGNHVPDNTDANPAH